MSKIKNLTEQFKRKNGKNTKIAKNGKKFKAPNTFVVLFFAIIFVIILSWSLQGSMRINDFTKSFLKEDANGVKWNILSGAKLTDAQLLDWLRSTFPSNTINAIENRFGKSISEALKGLSGSQYNYAFVHVYNFLVTRANDNGLNITDFAVALDSNSPNSLTIYGKFKPFGILDMFISLSTAFVSSAGIIVLVLMVATFVQIMLHNGAFQNAIATIQDKLKTKTLVLIPIFFVTFSFLAAFVGWSSEPLAFVPVIAPLMVLLGYDNITGFIVTMLGNRAGWVAPVLNPYSVIIPINAYNGVVDSESQISIGGAMAARIVSWILITTMGATMATLYAKRIRKNPEKSLAFADLDANKKWANEKLDLSKTDRLNWKQATGLATFLVMILIVVVGAIPWHQFSNSSPPKPGIGQSLGQGAWFTSQWQGFGTWTLATITALFFIGLIVLQFLFRMKTEETFKMILKAAPMTIAASAVFVMARIITVILNGAMIGNTISTAIASGMNGLGGVGFVLLSIPVFALLGVLVPSSSGLALMTMPVFGPSALSIAGGGAKGIWAVNGIINAYTVGLNSVSAISPTSGVHIAGAEAANSSYAKMLKVNLAFFGAYIGAGLLSTSLAMI